MELQIFRNDGSGTSVKARSQTGRAVTERVSSASTVVLRARWEHHRKPSAKIRKGHPLLLQEASGHEKTKSGNGGGKLLTVTQQTSKARGPDEGMFDDPAPGQQDVTAHRALDPPTHILLVHSNGCFEPITQGLSRVCPASSAASGIGSRPPCCPFAHRGQSGDRLLSPVGLQVTCAGSRSRGGCPDRR